MAKIIRPMLFLILALLATPVLAQPQRATVRAALNVDGLAPDKPAKLAVVLDIESGFHAQTNTPPKDYIGTNVKLKPSPSVLADQAVYPPGEIHQYEGIGAQTVYAGRTVVVIPITARLDAKAGPLRIEGTISYQICNDEGSCFPDETTPFTIETIVLPAGQEPQPANAEFFEPVKRPTTTTQPSPIKARMSAEELLKGLNLKDNKVKTFYGALGFAILAGLIFNIMPCVLPVLPLKALSFYEVAQHSRARSFLLSLTFSMGILTVFGVLAVFVVALQTIQWGEFFSQAWFIWLISGILVVMALGMFGAFSVGLPTAVYSITPRHDTYTGNFLFGILAAVLSTPCTAPLFPPLLGWAVSQPKAIGIFVMLMVGVGMAIPYVLLSLFPEVARRFPRTGPASELVKQMLGFLLLIAAAYFFGGRLIHGANFWWAVFAVVAMAAAFLVIRTRQLSRRLVPSLISGGIAVAMVAFSLMFVLHQTKPVEWQPYSDQALAQARAANRIVLVKFTANWCGNCQYIEARVFHDQQVLDALRRHGVVMLKADLTQKSAAGWPKLNALTPGGGIPLTAVWAPVLDEAVKLDSVYEKETLLKVLDAVDRS